jgi:hypothetical protein
MVDVSQHTLKKIHINNIFVDDTAFIGYFSFFKFKRKRSKLK